MRSVVKFTLFLNAQGQHNLTGMILGQKPLKQKVTLAFNQEYNVHIY